MKEGGYYSCLYCSEHGVIEKEKDSKSKFIFFSPSENEIERNHQIFMLNAKAAENLQQSVINFHM